MSTNNKYLDGSGVRHLYHNIIKPYVDGADSVIKTDIQALSEKCKELEQRMIPITHHELVSLRDAGNLIPGMQYRITDYEFTTLNPRLKAKPSTFDIIVTADDASTLNEDARAVAREIEAQPTTRLYAAWELKYTIDNVLWSASKGEWVWTDFDMEMQRVGEIVIEGQQWVLWYNEDFDPALGEGETKGYCATKSQITEDGTPAAVVDVLNKRVIMDEYTYLYPGYKSDVEGKGTILWMKDENRNSAYYDHHNALIKTYRVTACEAAPDVVGMYIVTDYMNKGDINPDDVQWMPTFGEHCHDNSVGAFNSTDYSRFEQISLNIFYKGCYNNILEYKCFDNTFGSFCYSNTFGSDCIENTFGNTCSHNMFGCDCSGNTFGSFCHSNTFGVSCYGNTFGVNCYGNTFGSDCGDNTFEKNCHSNTFGIKCKLLKISDRIEHTYVLPGTNNSKSTALNINFLAFKEYCQYAGVNSSGELKIWIPSELESTSITNSELDSIFNS